MSINVITKSGKLPRGSRKLQLEAGVVMPIPAGSDLRFKIAAGEYMLEMRGVSISLEKKSLNNFERLRFDEHKDKHRILCGIIDSEDDWVLRVQSVGGGEIELFACEMN